MVPLESVLLNILHHFHLS